MDESQRSLINSLPPFLSKIYKIVNDASTDAIVSWSQSNTSFIVWNRLEFERQVLPRFFKHNYSSFTIQLNAYGFRKVDSEQLEFAHQHFIRDRPHLLRNIHRQRLVPSHSIQNLQQTQGLSSSTLTDSERQVYNDVISTLKYDKQVLLSVLEKHKEEQRGFELLSQQLRDRLIRIEERHNLMMLSLAARLHKPAELSGLESQGKEERRSSQVAFLHEDTDNEHSRDRNSPLFSIKELCERLESSLTFWNKLHDVTRTFVSRFSDPKPGETISCLERNCWPSFSSPQLNVDAQSVTRVINMSSEPPVAVPSASDTAPPREQHGGSTSTAAVAGTNAAFWEEFLTENPEMLKIGQFIASKVPGAERMVQVDLQKKGNGWHNTGNGNSFAG